MWLASTAVAQAWPEAVALFDGASLAGWRGDPAVWSVHDGAIRGTSVGATLAANTFLVLDGQAPANFELTVQVRLEGDNNSGVQYRSRVLPGEGFRVGGYQCDLHARPNYTAMLYDEQGAGIVAERGQCVAWTDAGHRSLGALARVQPVDLSTWHTLRIVAMGELCWHELDGVPCTAFRDQRSNAPAAGVLALQVHAGAPMTVWFRAPMLRTWPSAEAMALQVPMPKAVVGLFAADAAKSARPAARGAVPQWLWDASPGDEEELFFRRSFPLTAVPKDAQLVVACDNHCRVYCNGEKVGESDAWEEPLRLDVGKRLRVGDNVLAVHAWNDDGPAGLAVRLSGWQAGAPFDLVSDAQWRCSDDDPDGWNTVGFADVAWANARALGLVGDAKLPWSRVHGSDAFGAAGDPFAPQVALVDTTVQVVAGEPVPVVEVPVMQVFDVPRALGSWVSLAKDPKGRLYAGAQGGGLYRLVPAPDVGETTTVERLPVTLDGAHGLLWWRDSLYAVVNTRNGGLYRLRDSDGDDVLDQVVCLQALDGSGEHGPHSVVVAPDGEHLLVVAGNQTKLPPLAKSHVPTDWAEDRLLPRLDDPNPYWEGISPPGGWICQCDADGRHWELLCCGFRNPYDVVVRKDGRMLTYDSDMEWDLGSPWYRPTRVLEVLPGADYGWRIGSAKWPADYPECPQAWQDIGPGSPTGMARCGDGFVMLDWTFGVVYAGVYGVGPVLTGAPLPLADVADGYLVTGGRGLPSRVLRVDPALWSSFGDEGLGPIHRQQGGSAVLPLITNPDPAARRTQVLAAIAAAEPWQRLVGLVALARTGTASDLPQLLEALGALPFASLQGTYEPIAWLRAHALGLLRLGPANEAQRTLIAQRLLPLFPTGNERVDQDLCELLAYVDAPGLLDKAVPLLAELRPSPVPAWANVRDGSDVYGSQYSGVITAMAARMPPIGQLAIADALRIVTHGWTLEQRRTYFTFLAAARTRKGGASYDGFCKRIVDAAWATCTPAEQQALAELVGQARAEAPMFRARPPQGPGRDWQLTDIDAVLAPGLAGADLAGADLAAGHNLFHAVGCASCHYFAGEGGNHGPDLTSLGNKFGPRDVLEAILAPSAVVSEQYGGQVLTRKDGRTLFGFVQKGFHGDTEVFEVMPAVAGAELVRVPLAEVAKVERSPLSPMPTDLVDRLSADELRQLLAFLLARGKH